VGAAPARYPPAVGRRHVTRKKKPTASLVRSSAAGYLTFVAASGAVGVEAVYTDENVWLSQKMRRSGPRLIARTREPRRNDDAEPTLDRAHRRLGVVVAQPPLRRHRAGRGHVRLRCPQHAPVRDAIDLDHRRVDVVGADELRRQVPPELEHASLDLLLRLLEPAWLVVLTHALSIDERPDHRLRSASVGFPGVVCGAASRTRLSFDILLDADHPATGNEITENIG
jgi:hypothetical protein